jgi:nitrite reductase/ring-hydroxylating ferredoxin subunit
LKFLCTSAHLPEGHSRGLNLGDDRFIAVRREGRVFVYRNRCPHRGMPLEWEQDRFLDNSASLIRCAVHGALFLIESGECVIGPCEGQSLTAIECEENVSGIWVRLSEQDG